MAILLKKKDGKDGTCYHMRDCYMLKHTKFWVDLWDNNSKERVEALRKFFTELGCNASCDWPSSPYWREQLEAFPEAKVVLATRDPESWYQSMMDTVMFMAYVCEQCPIGIRVLRLISPKDVRDFTPIVYSSAFGNDLSKDNMIKRYLEHIESVKKNCPSGKLFVFDVKEGWGPLCAFLGRPIPAVPYPHVNDTESFLQMVVALNTTGYILGLCGLGIPFLLAEPSPIKDEKKKSTNTGGKFQHKFSKSLLDYKRVATFYTRVALTAGAVVVVRHALLGGK